MDVLRGGRLKLLQDFMESTKTTRAGKRKSVSGPLRFLPLPPRGAVSSSLSSTLFIHRRISACSLRLTLIHTRLRQTYKRSHECGGTYRYKLPVPFGGRLASKSQEKGGRLGRHKEEEQQTGQGSCTMTRHQIIPLYHGD